jgi:class 3 adenylate cyclase
MGADEVATLQDLTRRRAILDDLIFPHRGRIANTAGDSVLAEFGSAVDAVQCAVEAQAALAGTNAGLAECPVTGCPERTFGLPSQPRRWAGLFNRGPPG